MAKKENAHSSEDPGNAHELENSPVDLSELKEKVANQVGPLVSGKSREQVVDRVVQIVRGEIFRGPLPHPKHLAEYEQTLPGAADRIITMTEKVIDGNLAAMKKAQEDEFTDKRLGLFLGFGALFLLVLGACFCAYIDKPYVAVAFLGTAACGAVAKFILGRENGNLKDEE